MLTVKLVSTTIVGVMEIQNCFRMEYDPAFSHFTGSILNHAQLTTYSRCEQEIC